MPRSRGPPREGSRVLLKRAPPADARTSFVRAQLRFRFRDGHRGLYAPQPFASQRFPPERRALDAGHNCVVNGGIQDLRRHLRTSCLLPNAMIRIQIELSGHSARIPRDHPLGFPRTRRILRLHAQRPRQPGHYDFPYNLKVKLRWVLMPLLIQKSTSIN
jgi:hypothetical protein